MSSESSIFINHAHENKLEALAIKDELELQGFDVHIDDEVVGGKSFVEWIDNNMEQSTCLVLIWSNHTVNKYWPNREWKSYLAGKISEDPDNNVIMVIRIDETDVPLIIRDLKWFSYNNNPAQSAANIASSLVDSPVENMREILARIQKDALESDDPLPFICTNCGHFPLETNVYSDDRGDFITIVATCGKCNHSLSYSPNRHSQPYEPGEDYDPTDDLFDFHSR